MEGDLKQLAEALDSVIRALPNTEIPENLDLVDLMDDLVKKSIIDEVAMKRVSTCKVNGIEIPLTYIPGYSSSGSPTLILLHTPVPIDGKRAILLNDGAVKTVPESTFQELISAQ